jgi:hypothetical protein
VASCEIPQLAWSFWYRRHARERWAKAGEAGTEREAWALLFGHDEPGDKTIASPGRDPNREKPR